MEIKKSQFSNIDRTDILILFIYYFIFLIVSASVCSTVVPKEYQNISAELLGNFVVGTWVFSNLKKNNIKNSYVFGKIKNYKELSVALIFSVILCFVSLFIDSYIIEFLQKVNLYFPTEHDTNLYKGMPLILNILLSMIVAPIVEELFFRGYVLNRLCEKYKISKAIFITTVLFSLAHGQRFWIVMLTSLCFSVIYIRTKSLMTSILCHSVYNAMVFIFGYYIQISNISSEMCEKILQKSFIPSILFLLILLYSMYKIWPSSHEISPYQYNEENL